VQGDEHAVGAQGVGQVRQRQERVPADELEQGVVLDARADLRVGRRRRPMRPGRSMLRLDRRRRGLPPKAIEALVLAGAFDRFGGTRQELLWDAYALAGAGRSTELALPEERPVLPVRPEHEQALLDYAVLGFSLERHLVAHYRRCPAGLRVVPSPELARSPAGQPVRLGGLVVCRQAPPTAKGFVFLTLEDEHGLMNVIVRPDVYARFRGVLREQPLVAIAGRAQRSEGPVNVLAERAVALDLGVPDPAPLALAVSPIVQPAIGSHDSR
jgi:error-prone DNA polymerase